jgi:hypothetical protein
MVYANAGVRADMEITLAMERDGGETAAIHFGRTGPEAIMDFADVDSPKRLALVAARGAQPLRVRIAANRSTATANAADLLIRAGVTR